MSLGSDGPYDCIATEYKLHSRNAIRAFFNDRPNPIRSDIPLLSFSQTIGRSETLVQRSKYVYVLESCDNGLCTKQHFLFIPIHSASTKGVVF